MSLIMDSLQENKQSEDHVEDIETSTYGEKEENALLRHIDLILVVPVWLMYLFSYADRTK